MKLILKKIKEKGREKNILMQEASPVFLQKRNKQIVLYVPR